MNIPIFLSSDNNYAPLVATCMASILANTKSFIEFYILDGGISPDNVEKIKSLKTSFDNFSVEFIKIDYDKALKEFNATGHWSKSTFSRLLIPNLKPNINKAIYLDVDIIATGDIAELYNENLNGHALGAVWEEFSEFMDEHITTIKRNMELSIEHKYFNAGVLLLDCTKWRTCNIKEKLYEISNKYANQIKMVDQDILNKYFDNNYKILARRYNYLTPFFWYNKEHKYIIRHLVGQLRPWQIKKNFKSKYIPNLEEFWYYAKMTPFYDELNSKAATGIDAQKLLLKARVEAIVYIENFKRAQRKENNEYTDISVK